MALTAAQEAQIAQARDETGAAIEAATPEARAEALLDLMVLLRGVAITNQEPGIAHAAARDVAESAVTAALMWLKG